MDSPIEAAQKYLDLIPDHLRGDNENDLVTLLVKITDRAIYLEGRLKRLGDEEWFTENGNFSGELYAMQKYALDTEGLK